MKTLIAVLLLLPGLAVAKSCPAGTTQFKDACVQDDAQPYLAEAVKPSDEKPPSDKMPSYQREGISISTTVTNMAADDEKADREKAEADAEGKHAAGIPGY